MRKEVYGDGAEEDEAFYERRQAGRNNSLRASSADMAVAHGQSGYVYQRLHGRGQAATVDPEADAFCSSKVMPDNICILPQQTSTVKYLSSELRQSEML